MILHMKKLDHKPQDALDLCKSHDVDHLVFLCDDIPCGTLSFLSNWGISFQHLPEAKDVKKLMDIKQNILIIGSPDSCLDLEAQLDSKH